MSIDDTDPRVTAPDGTERRLGDFLRDLRKHCGLPVTKIVERAGMSRANYYLLERDGQRPSLATAVSLFHAMGFSTSVPMAEDPELARDLVVRVGDEAFMVDLRWSAEERKKARDRYSAATDNGLGALGGFAGLGAAGAAGALGGLAGAGAAGALGMAGVAALGPLAPAAAIGGAILLAARRQAQRRSADRTTAENAPTQEDVLSEMNDVAESMTTEELEALLAAMKAVRDARNDGTATEG